MNKFSIHLFLFICIEASALAQSDCTLRKNEDGIKVYTCNTDTSKFKSIKVECLLNCTLGKLESILLDIDHYTQWQYNTKAAKVVKQISENELFAYTMISAPWPISDRDMAVHVLLNHLPDGLYVSANSEQGILPSNKDLVRVPASHSEWRVTEINKNQIMINYSIQIDPGGNVPAWLVNWVSANAPLQSFQALKKIAEEKK